MKDDNTSLKNIKENNYLCVTGYPVWFSSQF